MKRAALLLVAQVFLTGAVVGSPRYWINFRDKGATVTVSPLSTDPVRYALARAQVTEKSLRRRAKVLPADALVDERDLPLYKPYEDSVKAFGVIPINELRWFNAITAELTPQQIARIQGMRFVASVQPVQTLYCIEDSTLDVPLHSNAVPPVSPSVMQTDEDSLDYGESQGQLQQIQLTELHALGITGNGVLLGMLDDGFRWRSHHAEKTADVRAEYDFIFHDTITANQPGDDPQQDNHGTLTFSDVCAYAPGIMLGGAFNASFLLAKTEDIRSEKHIEEDNYAAALQWMDSLGVDVTSSSLGYNTFDSGQVSYSYADMNGQTTICARAVELAAQRGIIVVTAAGNEAITPWKYIVTPGDADTAITVGAVDASGVIAYFSSLGPTSDGRIKPDVCAQGRSTFGAWVGDSNDYIYADGTSLSTPLVASAVALILSAHPGIAPRAMQNALHATATLSYNPDTAYGWGIAQALDAALSFGMIFSNPPRIVRDSATGNSRLYTAIKALDGVMDTSAEIYYTSGGALPYQRLALSHVPGTDFYTAVFPQFHSGDTVRYYCTAESSDGEPATAPENAPQTMFSFVAGDTTPFRLSPINIYDFPRQIKVTPDFYLMQNYPSPFTGATQIMFGAPFTEQMTLEAYNIIGQKVATLFSGEVLGSRIVQWDATGLPPGAYVIRLTSPAYSADRLTIYMP